MGWGVFTHKFYEMQKLFQKKSATKAPFYGTLMWPRKPPNRVELRSMHFTEIWKVRKSLLLSGGGVFGCLGLFSCTLGATTGQFFVSSGHSDVLEDAVLLLFFGDSSWLNNMKLTQARTSVPDVDQALTTRKNRFKVSFFGYMEQCLKSEF